MQTSEGNGQGTRTTGQLADGLGWFSLALGTPQVTRPDRVNELIGVQDDRSSRFWQRIVGLRELAAAGGILALHKRTEWVRARVVGDLMDLTLLGTAFRRKQRSRLRLSAATASVVGVLVADLYDAVKLGDDSDAAREERPMKEKASITVHMDRQELYRRWTEFAQQPDGTHRFPAIRLLSAEPGEWLRFRTAPEAEPEAAGTVRFIDAVGNRGTEIHVELEHQPTAGALGAAVEKLKGEEPLQLIKDDLRRFRQLVELGEVVRSEGTPEGHSAKRHLHQRPAQPLQQANA